MTIIPFVLALTACTSREGEGSSSPPEVRDATLTDPDGSLWAAPDAVVDVITATGPACSSATWYQVYGSASAASTDVSLYAWFGIPDAGTPAYDPGVQVAAWHFDLPSEERPILMGGVGTALDDSPSHLEWQIEGGQVCTVPTGATGPVDYLCAAQTAPLVIEITGPWEGDGLGNPATGETGWATEATTGDAICGTESPGL